MSKEARKHTKGHRRAASCYNFDFSSMGLGIQSIQEEEESQKDDERVQAVEKGNAEDAFDFFEYFSRNSAAGPNEETSIIVDSIEADQSIRQKKELGLKYGTGIRIIKERRKENSGCGSQESLGQRSTVEGSSGRLVEVCESPRSSSQTNNSRITKIQVKYLCDLQKIDEDAHEISLANSRNSLALKGSAQKTLAKMAQMSASSRKMKYDTADNLILNDFAVGIDIEEDKENELERENKPNTFVIQPRKKTLKEIFTEGNSSCSQENSPKLVGEAKPPTPKQNTPLQVSLETPKSRKAIELKSCITKKMNDSSSIKVIEQGTKLIHKVNSDLACKHLVQATLQRLCKERAKQSSVDQNRKQSQGDISVLSKNDSMSQKPNERQKAKNSSTIRLSPHSRSSLGVNKIGPASRTPQAGLVKCASATCKTGLPGPSSNQARDDKMISQTNAMLVDILKNQSMYIAKLKQRMGTAEAESSVLANRFRRLKQENKKLTLEVDSLQAAHLSNCKGVRQLEGRVLNFSNIR